MSTNVTNVVSSKPIDYNEDKKFSASSVTLVRENNQLLLVNNTFRAFTSLLGSHQQDGQQVLTNIKFNTAIKPFTSNVVNGNIVSLNELKITNTAGFNNGDFFFTAGQPKFHSEQIADCLADRALKEGRCLPNKEEQAAFLKILSNYNYLYNSPHLLPVFLAWGKSGEYNGFDQTSVKRPCIHFDECKEAEDLDNYLYEAIFEATLPNHTMSIKTMINPGPLGYGGGSAAPFFGEANGKGGISMNENKTTLKDSEGGITGLYNSFHHESMHARTFSHDSGMTYGFSASAKQAVEHFGYDFDGTMKVATAETVFNIKTIANNKILVTLFSSKENQEMTSMNIEAFGGADLNVKISRVNDSQFHVETKETPTMRFYLRVFDPKSDQVMSKLVYPADFLLNTVLFTHEGADYHVISNAQWKRIDENVELESGAMSAGHAPGLCKGWFGNDSIKLAHGVDILPLLNTSYVEELAQSKLSHTFIGKKNGLTGSYKLYDTDADTWSAVDTTKSIVDNNANILCVN